MYRQMIRFFLICLGGLMVVSPIASHAEVNMAKVTIISVYDNYRVNPQLDTDWGFSCILKMPSETLLFDTGANASILLSNMQKMQISPKSVDKVVISHIHGDHVGGLKGFLEKNNRVTVFIPRSFPASIGDMIARKGAQSVEVSGHEKISDSVYTTGELHGPPKEQSLIIDSNKGGVIITGCAHPGIAHIVEKSEELMEKDAVYLVMGGFHRPPVSVVKKFKDIGVKKVAPSHCTGDMVRDAFAEAYQEDFIEYGVGKIINP